MSAEHIRSFRDLIAWRKALALCADIYLATDKLPRHERFGLCAELRKTARSVVYNIAEGQRRGRTLEFRRFLDISRGSAGELSTQVELCGALGYLQREVFEGLLQEVDEVERLLAGLKRSLPS